MGKKFKELLKEKPKTLMGIKYRSESDQSKINVWVHENIRNISCWPIRRSLQCPLGQIGETNAKKEDEADSSK